MNDKTLNIQVQNKSQNWNCEATLGDLAASQSFIINIAEMGQEEYTTRSTENHNFTHITGYSCLLDDTRPIEEVSLSAVKDCVLQDFSSYKEVLQLDKKYEVFGEKRLIEFSSTRCHVALQVTLSACVPSVDGSYRTSSSFISYDGDLGISKTQCPEVFRDGVLTLSFGREQLTLKGLEKNPA